MIYPRDLCQKSYFISNRRLLIYFILFFIVFCHKVGQISLICKAFKIIIDLKRNNHNFQ